MGDRFCMCIAADEEGANKANNNLVKVLVIGLHDNVESNYFPGSYDY